MKLEKSEFYYNHVRYDIIEFIESANIHDFLARASCLEVGCGGGITGNYLKKKYLIPSYVGVEYDLEASKIANSNLDYCYQGDIEDVINKIKDKKFDLILYLDVLEHLYDPWTVFEKVNSLLNENGLILISIPNASHYLFVGGLLTGKFEYNSNGGLLDSTHIRWFTLNNLKELLKGYKILKIKNKKTKFKKWYLRPFNSLFHLFFSKNVTIQYFLLATKR